MSSHNKDNRQVFFQQVDEAEYPICIDARDDAWRELNIENLSKAVYAIGKILDILVKEEIERAEHGFKVDKLRKAWDTFLDAYFDPCFPPVPEHFKKEG